MSIGSLLHDPSPIDVAISAWFVVTIGLLLAASFRRDAPSSDRAWWSGLTMVVTALLINQQADLHSPILMAARRINDTLGIDFMNSSMAALKVLGFVVVCVVAAAAIRGATAGTQRTGRLARVGVILMFLHAAGRGATFIAVVPQWLQHGGLHPLLQVIEVAGLTLIAVGALRYRNAPVRPQRPLAALV